ncbi:MAG: lipopolysaccharide biosynthesis protein [Clostridia bacterium]
MQQQQNIKQKAISGLFWKLMENGGTQGIAFLTSIVLARLIDPANYGVLSLTVIFTSIASVFVQRGFSLSLVQKKDADETDFSSVFYFSLVLALVLYLSLWISAPWIADFYHTPQVKQVLRAISLILVFGAVTSVQNAIIMREMAFRQRFIASVVSVVLSGTVGITMALLGFGVWALVAQQLLDSLIMCVGLSIATGWFPKRLFSFKQLGGLFSFGWKLLVSSLLETIYSDVSGLIIGRRYSPAMLAHYDKGRKFPQLIGTNLSGAIQAAMFPTFSVAQDDHERLRAMVRRSVAISAFVTFPLIAGLGAVGTPLIRLVLTEKWMPCVPFLQVFCITFALYPIDATVLQAINALGRSDLYLKLEIAKKIAGILLIFAAVYWLDTPIALAWALALTAVLSVLLNAIPIKRLIGYRYGMQLRDLLPSLGLSIIMGTAVYAVSFLGFSDWLALCIQIPLGAVLYAGIAWIMKMESFTYLIKSMQEIRRRKRKVA